MVWLDMGSNDFNGLAVPTAHRANAFTKLDQGDAGDKIMTKEETVLWNLTNSYLAKSGYSVFEIEPSPDGKTYSLKIKPFGVNTPLRTVTVFSDWLQRTAAEGCLVAEVKKNIDNAIGV